MNKSAFRGRLGVRPDYPTLRKEREGWGTRQLVAGVEPKSAFDPPGRSLIFRQSAVQKALVFHHHRRHGERGGVCEGERDVSDAKLGGQLCGASAQLEGGSASCFTLNLKFIPGDASAYAGSQCLCACFFGGEPCGKTFRTAAFAAAIGDLVIGKNAVQKAVAVAFDGLRNALNLDQIHARSDQHADHITMGSIPVIGITNRSTCSAAEDSPYMDDQLNKRGIVEFNQYPYVRYAFR